ncbi:hypothetical protein [Corynebacterium casei]|uniref:hypothetical protein n=1 Tax=Corynebacterium casei TaxID=160386 RepID=UPI003FD5BF8F
MANIIHLAKHHNLFDELAPNGKPVAYNLGVDIINLLIQLPEDESIHIDTLFSQRSDVLQDLEGKLNRWHESANWAMEEK